MRCKEAVRARILQLCVDRKISVNGLCQVCGITQSTINNIISGRNNSTGISTIQKICDGLEINLINFFDSPLFEDIEQEIV